VCLYPRQELNSRGIAAGQLSVKERWQFKYTPLSQSKVEQFYFYFSITSANGSAATDLRWGGSFELDFFCRSLSNLTVKIIMKICPLLSWSYCKNKSGLLLFFWDTVYYMCWFCLLTYCSEKLLPYAAEGGLGWGGQNHRGSGDGSPPAGSGSGVPQKLKNF